MKPEIEQVHKTYKLVPAPVHTVETALQWVTDEVRRLHDESVLVSAKFAPENPRMQGFLDAALLLRQFLAKWDLIAVDEKSAYSEVCFQLLVPRRVSHRKSRWSMVGDCCRALECCADMVGSLEYPMLAGYLREAAADLRVVTFPRLYEPVARGKRNAG